MNLSFDSRVKQNDIEPLAAECGDQEKPKWAREHVQYWLQIDYDEARLAAVRRNAEKHKRHPVQEADAAFAGEDMTPDQKLLIIHRTYYNFIKRGNDKKTPVMRMGIANAPLKFEDVVYFNPFDR